MRALERNKKSFWYCLYKGKEPIIDENGNESGEEIVTYDEPVEMRANISPATGYAQTEQFGNLDNYDKVIVTSDMSCPIDESTVLFIEKPPEFVDAVTYDYRESTTVLGEDESTPVAVRVPAPDYIVRRVARSLNSISIAVRKVDVS